VALKEKAAITDDGSLRAKLEGKLARSRDIKDCIGALDKACHMYAGVPYEVRTGLRILAGIEDGSLLKLWQSTPAMKSILQGFTDVGRLLDDTLLILRQGISEQYAIEFELRLVDHGRKHKLLHAMMVHLIYVIDAAHTFWPQHLVEWDDFTLPGYKENTGSWLGVIIDTSNWRAQAPSDQAENERLWNTYYGGCNYKFLVATLVSKLMIGFVGKLRPGQADDNNMLSGAKELFETIHAYCVAHNLYDKPDFFVSVLLDKGFDKVEELLDTFETLAVLAKMPVRLKQAMQCRVLDRDESAVISQYRIHVERSMTELKNFRELNNMIRLMANNEMYDVKLQLISRLCNMRNVNLLKQMEKIWESVHRYSLP
jgi:hypothetical protein